jgi:hypothetical protein
MPLKARKLPSSASDDFPQVFRLIKNPSTI